MWKGRWPRRPPCQPARVTVLGRGLSLKCATSVRLYSITGTSAARPRHRPRDRSFPWRYPTSCQNQTTTERRPRRLPRPRPAMSTPAEGLQSLISRACTARQLLEQALWVRATWPVLPQGHVDPASVRGAQGHGHHGVEVFRYKPLPACHAIDLYVPRDLAPCVCTHSLFRGGPGSRPLSNARRAQGFTASPG